MAKLRAFIALATVTVVAGVAWAGNLSVASSAFKPGGAIPVEDSCRGTGAAPPLSWGDVPAATRSIAVVVVDPDAPNGTFTHLAAYNLPPTRRSLPSEALQSIGPGSALQTAKNSLGGSGFAPICPPSGVHHYHFRVLALDNVLDLPPGATASDVQHAAEGHVLAEGELVGTFAARR